MDGCNCYVKLESVNLKCQEITCSNESILRINYQTDRQSGSILKGLKIEVCLCEKHYPESKLFNLEEDDILPPEPKISIKETSVPLDCFGSYPVMLNGCMTCNYAVFCKDNDGRNYIEETNRYIINPFIEEKTEREVVPDEIPYLHGAMVEKTSIEHCSVECGNN